MGDELKRGYLRPRFVEGYDPAIDSMSERISELEAENERLRAEIEQLRAEVGRWVADFQDVFVLKCKADDEIERLRAEVGRLRNSVDTLTNMLSEQCDMSDRYALAANKAEAENERLRASADQLANALRAVQHDRPSAHTDDVWAAINQALITHDEARRG